MGPLCTKWEAKSNLDSVMVTLSVGNSMKYPCQTGESKKHQEDNKNPGSKDPGNKHARLEHQILETNMPGWKTKPWKPTCLSW